MVQSGSVLGFFLVYQTGLANTTWVAMYVINGSVMQTILCIQAFPEHVAFGSLSMELGEVNVCLNACKNEYKASKG
jgi:hypothetical protein